jgi:hypothetical protein
MKALPASRGPTRTARERRACYPLRKQKLFSRGAHRLTATARAALAFAAASACIEPSWLYDRSVTLSHAAAEFLGWPRLGQNLGEDHLVARTLVSAARVALVVLLGGIVLASIAIPSWLTFEYRAGENALRKLGASFSEAKSGGLLVELPTQISDDTLIKEGPHLERLDVAHLNLPHSKLTSLEPLKGLTNLSSLDLLDAAGITGLEPLKGLTNLSSLDLSYATGVTSLEPLKGLTKLSSLDLRNATGITSLEPLKGLTKLSSLDLRNATGVTSLEPLKGLTKLSSLDLRNATGITSLEPLKGLTKLSSLDLRNATGVTSLEPLKGLANLRWLDLSYATGITSLEPLSGLTSLRSLYLDNAAGITSLEPLKGLRVRIYGASDELLATMN